jgi:hypothetical protein
MLTATNLHPYSDAPASDQQVTIEQALAEALHEWRKTQSLAGCGWKFRSDYCPCPADAAAILATEPMQAIARDAAVGRDMRNRLAVYRSRARR